MTGLKIRPKGKEVRQSALEGERHRKLRKMANELTFGKRQQKTNCCIRSVGRPTKGGQVGGDDIRTGDELFWDAVGGTR